MKSNREGFAWAAGFFDEEGHAKGRLTQAKYQYAPKMSVANTDIELLTHFQSVVGNLGKIYGPYTNKPKRKAYWVWHSCSFEHTQAVFCMLYPFLGTVKRGQYIEAMKLYLARIRDPSYRSKDRTLTCECRDCGSTFKTTKSTVENGRGKFCSRKCLGKYRSKHGIKSLVPLTSLVI